MILCTQVIFAMSLTFSSLTCIVWLKLQCNPNAHVAGVWIETNDPAIPLLALFAKRTIKKGEEITFDYQGNLLKI